MRVKLSYTVEEDTVLTEAAKIVNLCAGDMQHAITLFNDVQVQLTGTGEEAVNTTTSIEMLEEFRRALMNIDTRLFEVQEIIDGYEKYVQSQRAPLIAPGSDEELTSPTAGTLLQG
tara:strand:- start:47 stop:394 length:348 start_codon:yes stop_codon:yes gene_type:complete